jgi:hypothetical protein
MRIAEWAHGVRDDLDDAKAQLDDYCRRVEHVGKRVVCAEDVFVHHHFSASFDVLAARRKWELFERNRKIYEARWGPWKPYRDSEPG